MTNIFIDIPMLLEHRSQVAKCVFLGYHLTIESDDIFYCRENSYYELKINPEIPIVGIEDQNCRIILFYLCKGKTLDE
jgi:hypothetical protein